MKNGLGQEVNWEYMGAILAGEDDDTQAKFIKAFVKECLSWGTNYQAQMQLSYINSKLTKDEKEFLSMITYDESQDNI